MSSRQRPWDRTKRIRMERAVHESLSSRFTPEEDADRTYSITRMRREIESLSAMLCNASRDANRLEVVTGQNRRMEVAINGLIEEVLSLENENRDLRRALAE